MNQLFNPRRVVPAFHGAVRLGVLMLCHDNLALATQMVRLWNAGGAAVVIHVDSKADPDEFAAMQAQLADCADVAFTDQRHDCEWGMFSLVQATQAAAELMLERFADVSHIYLASGACLPLRAVSDLTAYLGQHPHRDFIESVTCSEAGWIIGGLGDERFHMFFPVSFRRRRKMFDRLVKWQRRLRIRRKLPDGLQPHLGSQWWCLTRDTLAAILNDPQRAEYDRYFRHVWIPDESYFQSLARKHSVHIESRSLTVAKFDMQGKPYILYDDHAGMLEQSGCFVARKVWPRANGLYGYFPRPPCNAVVEPDPLAIDRLIDATVSRRRLGRPGLYMQSRFPSKDRENGKTAHPYVVMQGFTDLFEDFEEWLWDRADMPIHGHLFAADQVEFGGRSDIGPGALTSSALIRDLDPQGFLTSLIRSQKRASLFQYSPRDTQSLNWFMATDPNATIIVVTGAWLMPLMLSGMPFDDIRRIASRLEQREVEQLSILRSVWVKARVRVWDLGEFLADPTEVMNEALDLIDPQRGLYTYDLPAMRDHRQIGRFVQSLRNAGLYPRMTGNLPVDAPLTKKG